jgi:hypothetical protein
LLFNASIRGVAMQSYRTVAGDTVASSAANGYDGIATFGPAVQVIIGVAAFALGVLVGAHVAAWVIPPI